MSRASSQAAKAATAGGESPSQYDAAAEAASEARAIEAETVVQPGGSLTEVLCADRLEGTLSHLHVRALPEHGFRRAGRFWPPGEGVTVIADHFSDGQLVQLLSEPNLVVTPILREAAE